MKKVFLVVAAAATVLVLGSFAQANITIDTVTVGDSGNAGELSGAGNYPPSRICGSVDYTYNIGRYEVTAGQYTAFLNAVARTDTYGLYNANMWSSSSGCKIQRAGASGSYTYSVASPLANKPVNCVSYWDACRFTNWLHNGQLDGAQNAFTTERGAYTLDGYNGSDGSTIQRNATWRWAVTSEDEWYKAAYYKGGGPNAGYWLYPTQSNSVPSNDITSPDAGNNACFNQNGFTMGGPDYRTIVGEFENSESAYGTFDQGGNFWEWNEAVIYQDAYPCRGMRGGSFYSPDSALRASHRDYEFLGFEGTDVGFRVSQSVPEPSPLLALLGGLAALLGLRRRRA